MGRITCNDPEDYDDFAACVAVAKDEATPEHLERLAARKVRYA